MMWIQGGDLLEEVMRRGCVAESEARNYTQHVLQALLYLDFQAIAHRDVKAENLMLSSRGHGIGNILLVDFGFAKETSRFSGCRTLCGTPMYAAPEI